MKVHASILQSFDRQGLDQVLLMGGLHIQLPFLPIDPDQDHVSAQVLLYVISLVPQLKTAFRVQPAFICPASQGREPAVRVNRLWN